MNHKQKLGYIALGASIMLIGMWIGNAISPPVTAQNDGELTCQKLTFVDETGTPLYWIQTTDPIAFGDSNGGLSIFTKSLNWDTGKQESREILHIQSNHFDNRWTFRNPNGTEAVSLYSNRTFGGLVRTLDKEGKRAVDMSSRRWVALFNNQEKCVAEMSVNEYGNGAVATWDKNGNRQ